MSISGGVTINLIDVNEPPVSSLTPQTATVSESLSIGGRVGGVLASDMDSKIAPNFWGLLQYRLVGGNGANKFLVSLSTSDITLISALDYESVTSYSITISATDGGGLAVVVPVVIAVLDINEPPVIQNLVFSVLESSPAGALVGNLVARDPDVGQTAGLVFTLQGESADGKFILDGVDLIIGPGTSLNYNTKALYVLTVRVSDGSLSSDASVTVKVLNINHAPMLPGSPYTLSIPENSPAAFAAGAISGTDADLDDLLSYALIPAGGDPGVLTINPCSGQALVATGVMLDFEARSTYTITVTVTDNGVPPLGATGSLSLHITDVNEAPSFPSGGYHRYVLENAVASTLIGDPVIALDLDLTAPYNTVRYAVAPSGLFTVDPITAQLSVKASYTIDFEVSSVLISVVQATDGGSPPLSASAVVSIAVLDVNEPPIFNPMEVSVPENSIVGYDMGGLQLGKDPEGKAVSYALVNGSGDGMFQMAASDSGFQLSVRLATIDFETTPTGTILLYLAASDPSGLTTVAVATVRVLDVNEPPVLADFFASLDENAAVGTKAAVLAAADPDFGQILTYTLKSQLPTGSASFKVSWVDSRSAKIEVAAANLDFEAQLVYRVTVEVCDSGLIPGCVLFAVGITLDDVEEAPELSPAFFAIAENSNVSSLLTGGPVVAFDPDAGNTLTFTFVSDIADGAFAMDAISGVLSVAMSVLDFESHPNYHLTVTVADSATPAMTAVAEMFIAVTNVNEAPHFTMPLFSVGVSTTASAGYSLGFLAAKDPDAVDQDFLMYRKVSHTDLDASGSVLLAVDAVSGRIFLIKSLEKSAADRVFTIAVEVADSGGMTDSGTLVVTVIGTNNNPPLLVCSQTSTVPENSVVGYTILSAVPQAVSAIDSDLPAQILTFSLLLGNTRPIFGLNNSTGGLTVASASLDIETKSQYIMDVQVRDNGVGMLSASCLLLVTVTNVNEPPVFSPSTLVIDENENIGAVVGSPFAAADPDYGDSITYAFVGASNTDGTFALSSVNGLGKLSVAKYTLDFEKQGIYMLQVSAKDRSGLSVTTTITVLVQDVNDAPKLLGSVRLVEENSAAGVWVGLPLAQEASDQDKDQILTYTLVERSSMFALDSVTGQLSVVGSLDYEAQSRFSLSVKVCDNGTPQLSTTATVNVSVVDVNEAPVLSPRQYFSINENSILGNLVGSAGGFDPDRAITAFGTLSWSMTPGRSGDMDDVFTINPASGAIRVTRAAIDYETLASYSFTLVAVDGGGLNASAELVISVLNEDDPPVFRPLAGAYRVREDAAPDEHVVIGAPVTAYDPDVEFSVSYSVESCDPPTAFGVNALSGLLYVRSAVLDYEKRPIGTVVIRATEDVQFGGLRYFTLQTVEIVIINVNDIGISAVSAPNHNIIRTAGGESVTIMGHDFHMVWGPSVLPVVTYGPSGVEFSAASCTAQSSVTHETCTDTNCVIVCLSVPGIGSNHTWRVSVGEFTSASSVSVTSYGPPVLLDVNPGAMRIDTRGGDVVVLKVCLSSAGLSVSRDANLVCRYVSVG
jgi:hypothetical protein